MERTKETLEARVRETPLVDRLKECQKRIGNMCAELRGPKMSIPVEYYDDDFYICTTLADAQATVEALQARLEQEREKVKFGSCEVCWNLAWVLCRDDEPNAVPMKCANGTTYWRCDYCWYKQQLATLQAQLRQVEGENELLKSGQRYMALEKERDTLRQLVEVHTKQLTELTIIPIGCSREQELRWTQSIKDLRAALADVDAALQPERGAK